MDIEKQYKIVVDSLKLLAAEYEKQKQYLPNFADVADDVISNFENAFLLLPVLIDNNRLTNKLISSILRIYNKVQWCLRNVDLDNFSDVEWNKIRESAKDVLIEMNELDY